MQLDPSHLLNAAPLPEPVNAFTWTAGVLEQWKDQGGPEAAAHLAPRIAWLQELGRHVDFVHNDPVLMLALSRLALDQRLRLSFAAAVNAVEAKTREAMMAQAAAAQQQRP